MVQIIPKRCKGKPAVQKPGGANEPPRWYGGLNFVWVKKWGHGSENSQPRGTRRTRYYMGRAKPSARTARQG